MKKRILSLLLVLTMLVSLVPSFAVTGDEGSSYLFNLGRLQWGQWSSQGNAPSTLTDWDVLDGLENYYNRTSDPFMFYGQSSGMDWRWTSTSAGSAEFGPRGPTISGASGAWGGIKVRVEESAQYEVTVKHCDYTAAPTLNIYLAPADAKEPLDTAYFLGTTTNTGDSGSSQKTASFGTHYLPEGEYAVIFEIAAASKQYGSVAEVGLTWVTDEEPEPEPESYLYDLSRLQWGQWSDQGNAPSTLTDWDVLESLGNWHNRVSDPFMFYGQSEGFSWTWTKTSAGSAEFGPRGPSIASEVGEWGGINIRVGQTALYDFSVRFTDYEAAPALKVYLAPCGVENPMDKKFYMGIADPTSDNVAAMKTEVFGRRYLPAGDYTVIIENATGTTGTLGSICSVGLDFVSYEPSERLLITGSAEPGIMGESIPVSISATWDGEEIALSELDKLRVDITDRTIATMTETEGNYSVTGIWKGEIAIRVSAEHQGEITAIDVPVTILLPEGYLELAVEAGDALYCKTDETAVIPMVYYVNRDPVSINEVEITAEIEDPSLADVMVDADGNLQIVGKLGGKSSVTVTISKNGKSISKEFPIEIDAVKFFYSLHNGYQGPWSDSVRPIDYFVEYDMYDKNPEGELPLFWTAETEPWKFIAKSGGLVAEVNKSFRSVGYMITGGTKDWLNMGIKVRESGTYDFTLRLTGIAGGGTMDLYVSPMGTPQEELNADRYYVGKVNGTAAATTTGELRSAGNVTLTAGEYNVYCEIPAETVGTNGIWLVGFCLNSLSEHQFRLSGSSDTPIMESASGKVPLTAFYDGAEIDFTDVTDITVTSKDENIATAAVVHTGAEAYLEVNGIVPGSATMTVTAKYGDLVSEKDITVQIVRKDQIKLITLTAEKQNLDAGERVQTSLSATRYNGLAASLEGKNIYYESSNPNAIAVNAQGVITAIEKGESIVRAWIKTEEGTVLYDEILVTVNNHSPIADVKLSCGDQITVGTNKEVLTSVILTSGAELPTDLYTAEVTVESVEPDGCLRVENGIVYAETLGSATLKVAINYGADVAEFTKTVTVVPVADISPKPESLVLNAKKTTISVGETTELTAGAYYTDGKFVSYDASAMLLEYDSDILGYENGKLIARAPGVCEVKFSVSGMEKSLTMVVDEETLGSATVSLENTLYVGKTAQINYTAYTDVSVREIAHSDVTVSYESADHEIATVDEFGVVSGVSAGETAITVTVTLADKTVIASLPITVSADVAETIELTVEKSVMKPDDTDGILVTVNTVSQSGAKAKADLANVTFESLNPDLLTVKSDGTILPMGTVGSGLIRATYAVGGVTLSSEIEITVKAGKTAATYYTKSKLETAKENVEKYEWAKNNARTFEVQVSSYVGKEEWLSNLVTSQELPRNLWAAYDYDPNYQNCRYCGTNMAADTGESYPYLIDIVNYPWKIQCPTCRRRFPSNDFGAFYQTGLDEHGFWRYEQAKQNGSHLLTNDLYPEKGVGWGVDDGYGYKTGKTYTTGYGEWEETWTFIAYYNTFGIWSPWVSGGIPRIVRRMTLAYTYTGKPEYGRALAVLIDRIADVYPEMSTGVYEPQMLDNGWYGGKFVGGISDTTLVSEMILAYDAVFDLYDDPTVLKQIQSNAARWNQTNKDTPAEIREHIETDLLLETKAALENKQISGNNGMHQMTMAYTGVVLDRMPESKELIDGALTGMKGLTGTANQGILVSMTNTVNRDGHGTENSIMYNGGWVSNYARVADALADYTAYPGANLYKNPKFVKMLKMNLPLTMARRATLNIGDCYGLGDTALTLQTTNLARALMAGCEDPEFAQILYFMNGNQYNGSAIRDIYLDSDAVAAKIKEMIEEHGEYDFDKSTQMTGFGVGVLRGGTFKADNVQNINTQRAVALWYGPTYGHGHSNTLDLSMYAYGINVMPAFGYPTNTSGSGLVNNWERATISHNTVSVNGVKQGRSWSQPVGTPLHFDDSGRVKLTDARNLNAYEEQGVSEYRRTAIMVEVNDADAYTVDLFRIIGGNEHVYSFHSQSNTVAGYEGLDPIYQEMGTYAGPNVPYGPGNLASGYDSFYDVYRTTNPGNQFSITFKVDDFRKVLNENRDLHLRVTQVNDFELDDVSFASAAPPNIHGNTREIKYLLARRNGKDLDSLFTTVIEPYDGKRFISKIEAVPVADQAGNLVTKEVKAVKVTLETGREDYIVYATDKTARYRIDDRFDFIGFVGVISYQNGEVEYRYLHDGIMLDGMYGTDAMTGSVVGFTGEMEFENFITIRADQSIDASELIGKTIYVNNNIARTLHNGAYPIHGAQKNSDGTYTLDIGDYTLINSVSGKTYTYNIGVGQTFSIPLTTLHDPSPIVELIEDQVITVGDILQVTIDAESPVGRELIYRVANNVSGAAMVGNVLYFSPTQGQTGNVAIPVEVSDGYSSSTVNINVTVYPSTGGGGGGGGNGGTSTDEVTYTDNGDNTFTGSDGNVICAGSDKTIGTADDITNIVKGEDDKYYIKNADGTLTGAGEDGLLGTADDIKVEDATTPIDPSEKFVDLGNHTWAKEAIYRLVDAGIIKGVDDTHYAPAKQITRADFAILLVRAWSLTAEELGTFDDVAESDYYYNEVGIASALGIVKGVGENKFDPKAPITREQMMVMLNRTLTVVEAELAEVAEDVLADFSDADEISDYAIESVKLMIGNGYIQGANGKINPQGNATRAEVAVLLDRILGK